jgi:hypothetical protein
MWKQASPRAASVEDHTVESVFVRRRPIPGERPGDNPVRLREDVHQEALAAATEVLRHRRSLPPEALNAIIEAIHSPPNNLTPQEAAIDALQAYEKSHPFQ